MSTIYIVRHGQASFGKENYDVLSPQGHQQSRMVADHFISTGITFDCLYSGTMERQVKTAEEIAVRFVEHGHSVPELVTRSGFNEYDTRSIIMALLNDLLEEQPELEEDMKNFYSDRKAFQRIFEPVMLRWARGDFQKPGLESWEDVKTRVRDSLTRIMSENGRGRSILIVASGGPIAASVQYATGLSDDAAMRLNWQMVNTGITRFLYNETGITLQSFNNFSHLELAGDRELVTYR